MPWIVAVAFLLLWGLGLGASFTVGGWIHVLVVLAVVAVVFHLLQGRPFGFRHGGHHPT
ncbi:MAG TPA: lmo0937 family membrane protein [Myxococcales bacterium]|jgi:hypothetical protein